MESALIWLITVILIIGIITPYFIKFRKRQKLDHERIQEAQQLGLNRPRGQYPLIDMAQCIGCGSCVKACPEEDVLGIVFGRAVVINGQRCVGHGFCETACPVGAIKVGLGDIKTRPDIPVTDENGLTNIPGIYIAGELGGLSLIRNAIEQGRKTVDHIVQSGRKAATNDIYDILIVGAGPAGMSASLASKKHGLRYLTLDQQAAGGTILQYPRQKLVMTQAVEIPLHGILKEDEYTKESLLELWQEITKKHELNIHSGEKVNRITRRDDFFEVISDKGSYRGATVILAMGRRGTPRKLGVEGEELPKTLYQLVDAQSYQAAQILVVGGGDSAVEVAVGLARQEGNKVTISYRQNSFARVKKKNEERINELIAQKKIHPIFNSNVLEIGEKTVKLKVGETETREIANDFVFVLAGGEPPFKILQEIGVAFGGEAKAVE